MNEIIMRLLETVQDWVGWLILLFAVIAIFRVVQQTVSADDGSGGKDKSMVGEDVLKPVLNILINAAIAYVIVQVAFPLLQFVTKALGNDIGAQF